MDPVLAWQLRNASDTERRDADMTQYRRTCADVLHNMDLFYQAYPQEMPPALAEPEYLREQRRRGRQL